MQSGTVGSCNLQSRGGEGSGNAPFFFYMPQLRRGRGGEGRGGGAGEGAARDIRGISSAGEGRGAANTFHPALIGEGTGEHRIHLPEEEETKQKYRQSSAMKAKRSCTYRLAVNCVWLFSCGCIPIHNLITQYSGATRPPVFVESRIDFTLHKFY